MLNTRFEDEGCCRSMKPATPYGKRPGEQKARKGSFVKKGPKGWAYIDCWVVLTRKKNANRNLSVDA